MTEFQNETDDEILEQIIAEKYGDSLSDEEITEMTQMALFCSKAEGDNRWSGAIDNAKDELERVYGVTFDDLRADVRRARRTGEIPEGTGMDLSKGDGYDNYDGLIREIKEADAPADELLVIHDPSGGFRDLVGSLNTAEVSPDEVAVGRESDLKDIGVEKRSLIDSLSESKGIDPDSLSNLSLPDLRSLTDSDRSGPDPKSGDPDPDRSVPRGKRDELAKLQDQKDFLERKNGALAESRLSQINDRIRELRGE